MVNFLLPRLSCKSVSHEIDTKEWVEYTDVVHVSFSSQLFFSLFLIFSVRQTNILVLKGYIWIHFSMLAELLEEVMQKWLAPLNMEVLAQSNADWLMRILKGVIMRLHLPRLGSINWELWFYTKNDALQDMYCLHPNTLTLATITVAYVNGTITTYQLCISWKGSCLWINTT